MNPPMVYDVTSPSSQRTRRMTKMVQSIEAPFLWVIRPLSAAPGLAVTFPTFFLSLDSLAESRKGRADLPPGFPQPRLVIGVTCHTVLRKEGAGWQSPAGGQAIHG